MEATGSEEEKEQNGEEYTMFRVVAEGKEPYRVVIDLNGISTSMEVDTGAAATIISEETFKEINQGHSAKKKVEMKPAHVKLRTYTGELVKVLGTVDVVVKYEGQENELSALVVEGSGPSLLGRDWLKEVLDWKKLFKMNMDEKQVKSRLEKLINQYSEVFEEGLRTFTGPKAKIHVEVDAVPKFCKARPVPYAIKGKIEEELKRLQEEGTIESVQFSEWAAPIVPIRKPDNSIRICGDYKTTVHQVSKLDNYPIPKVEDLLATLGGGEKFTKLDVNQTYQQLQLDDESKRYTILSTHIKGCFSIIAFHREFRLPRISSNVTWKICYKTFPM